MCQLNNNLMLTKIDKNGDGVVDSNEAREVAEDIGAYCGESFFRWLYERFFSCLFKSRQHIE